MDIGFIIDGSGSIRDANPVDGSHDNWNLLLNFVAGIINGLPRTGTRVGAVVFSDRGQLVFDFEQFSNDLNGARDFLLTTDYPGANTNTSGGLYTARVLLFNNSKGEESDVSKLAVVITDGKSTYDSDKTLDSAEDLKGDGVEIITVGITGSIDEEELRAISSFPQMLNQNYFTSADFQQLENIIGNLLATFCSPAASTATVRTSSVAATPSDPCK